MNKTIWTGAVLLACGLPAAAAGLEDIHKQYQAGQVKELRLETVSCNADVKAGDRDATALDVVKSDSDDFTWEIELKGAKLTVKEKSRRLWHGGSNKDCLASVSLPKGAAVRVSTVSGELKLGGITGGPVIDTTSGNMDIRLSGGGARISTVSGEAAVRGLSGDLKFKSVSGNLEARWDKLPAQGQADLHTVSGEAVLWLPGSPSVKASLSSVSGDIDKNEFSESAKPDFTVKAETVSGDLSLLKAK